MTTLPTAGTSPRTAATTTTYTYSVRFTSLRVSRRVKAKSIVYTFFIIIVAEAKELCTRARVRETS